jgi:tetratricopeptide (TPR) repeat protein
LEKQALNFSVLQNPQGEMTAQRGVAAAFELSWNELDERGRYLGCLLSIFALAPIPWNLVEKCLSKDESREKGIIQRWFPTFSRLWLLLMPPKKVDVLDSRTWEDIREDTLLDLNLIQKTTQGTYELHQLVRRYFQDKLNAMKEAEQLKSQFCRVIVGAARKIPDNITVEQVKEVEIDIPHITEIADNLAEYLSNDDLITPFTRLGSFYEDQGLYPLAQPWLEKGKEIAEKRLDKNNSDIATVCNNLAGLYKSQGKYEAAEQLYLQAIEINKIALPENHPSLAINLNNLASLYYSQGKYEAAEPLYLQAIEIDKIALPENHPERAIDLNNLALLYKSQGKYEAAEPLFLQAIEIDKIALPENHPERAKHLNNLANVYRSQGKYEAAEPLFLQAIEIDKIALPENHPERATHLNNLAGLYDAQGKYEAAEPLYLQAIEIFTQSLGEEHPNTQTVLINYLIFLNEKNESKQSKDKY